MLSDDRQIGTMTAYISVHHGTVDVGIMIGAKSVWGEGYGQDAWNTFVNWLFGMASCGGDPMFDVLFIYSETHRCLHDRIAGTYVVNLSGT